MLVARRVAVRAAAAAMTSYAANDRARARHASARRDGPRARRFCVRPSVALRQVSQTDQVSQTERNARWGAADAPSSSSSDDDDDGKVAILRRHFPAAPRAELQRFADARPDGGAVEFYRAYQRWRLEEGAAEDFTKESGTVSSWWGDVAVAASSPSATDSRRTTASASEVIV